MKPRGRLSRSRDTAKHESNRDLIVLDSLEPKFDVVSRVSGFEFVHRFVEDGDDFDGGLWKEREDRSQLGFSERRERRKARDLLG